VTAPNPDVALVAYPDRDESQELSRLLTACGWQVLVVHDGGTALEALRTRAIRLAVLGVALRPQGGPEVVAAARAAGWPAPAVVIDTAARSEVRARCEELDDCACLAGPLGPLLLARLREYASALPTAPTVASAAVQALQELEAGTRVQLQVVSGAAAGSYPALVMEASPASVYLLAHPTGRRPFYVSLGTPVRVGFPSPRGWGEFESRVAGSYARGTEIEITLSPPTETAYRQRRHWPRVPVSLPVRAWPSAHPDRAGVMVSGQTDDIAQTGLRASFQTSLPETEFVTLLVGQGERELRIGARPIWHRSPAEDAPTPRHSYGFQFVHPDAGMRRAVTRLLAEVAPSQRLAVPGATEALPGMGSNLSAPQAAGGPERERHARIATN
jgi:hypothetical protein